MTTCCTVTATSPAEHSAERRVARYTDRAAAAVSLTVLLVLSLGIVGTYHSPSAIDRLWILPLGAFAFLALSAMQGQAVIALARDARVLPLIACAVGSSLWLVAIYLATAMPIPAAAVGVAASACLGIGVIATPRRDEVV